MKHQKTAFHIEKTLNQLGSASGAASDMIAGKIVIATKQK